MPEFTATYSPDDNKLRLYSMSRLEPELYKRVKAAGFSYAPKQELFFAPMWTPEREDLLLELCGEIDDEDKSLVERAEERAERFEDYSEKRETDAHRAREAVASIADNIPLGQPILVGHHSEKHARRDAARIENGMKRAVKLWETSKYWTQRAAGAIRHAKYKELSGVRHRRIKGLEADKRKHERAVKDSNGSIKLWQTGALSRDLALKIANYEHVRVVIPGHENESSLWSALEENLITPAKAAELAIVQHNRIIERANRWIAHLDNRLAYERAMLDETGGSPTAKFDVEVGGRVLIRNEWFVVMRVNRANGVINSVTINSQYCRVRGIETITDYRAPEPDDAEKVKKVSRLAPLTNFPSDGCINMTKAEWDRRPIDCKMMRTSKGNEKYAPYRYREAFIPGGSFKTASVFITDAKRVDPPLATPTEAEPVEFERQFEMRSPRAPRVQAEPSEFDAMREQIKQGVKVVQADQLFATPPELAARVVRLAQIEPEHTVLEPSAGTGNLVREIKKTGATVVAVEVNRTLADAIGARCDDFTTCDGLGTFDRIVMNPPFANGQDVEHVTRALTMLAPGGRLVAIMSKGIEFRNDKKTKAFRQMVKEKGNIIELPEDSFVASGTSVRTVLVTVNL